MEFFIALLALGLLLALHRIGRLATAVTELRDRLEQMAPEAVSSELPARPAPQAASRGTGFRTETDAAYLPPPAQAPNSPASERAPQTSSIANPGPAPMPRLRPTSSPQPREEQPSAVDRIVARVTQYFTGGNLVVRVGVIVLFFGVAFLLQYANAQGAFNVPIEFRLAAVAFMGLGLLGLGWWLRRKRRTYGLILQGGGLGITYITVFAAMQLYEVLPSGVSLLLLVVMVGLAGALAVLQNSSSLAVIAVIGGFLAPILTSTGQGSHIALFSYYLVLNAGILGVAWFRPWRALNLLGFVFTFVIATLWGVLEYRPRDRPSAQIFLILFFVFYVLIAVLYARRQPPHVRGVVDATLVFGVPVVAFGLQAGLVSGTEYGLAISAVVLSAFYAAGRQLCRVLGGPAYLLLSRAFLSLALVFGSLSIPLAFDGEWVATAWAIEGAAVLWIALKQRSRLTVLFALGLQAVAGLLYIPVALFDRFATLAVANAIFLGGLLLAIAGFVSSWLLRQAVRKWGYRPSWRWASWVMAGWALAWWLGNGMLEIFNYVDVPTAGVVALLFIAATAVALGLLEVWLRWAEWRFTSAGLLAFMVWAVIPVSINRQHPFADGFGWGWLAMFAALYTLLWVREIRRDVPAVLLAALHTGAWWLGAFLLAVEAMWLLDLATGDWFALGVPVVLVPMVCAAVGMPGWPLARHRRTYLGWGSGLPVAGLIAWSLLIAPARSGDFDPLPHLPMLNPLDLAQLFVLITLVFWWRRAHDVLLVRWPRRYGWVLACGLAFAWLSTMLLRALHQWSRLDYTPGAMWNSDLAQASVSILWTLIALTAMVLATARAWRRVWVAAVGILGVVVVKLFIVDMQGSDTLGTIIAFIAVGLLLLLAGYLSPLPPKRVPDIEEPQTHQPSV